MNFETLGEYVLGIKKKLEKAHKIVRDKGRAMLQYREDKYDAKYVTPQFEIGSLVMYLNQRRIKGVCPKLQPRYIGPAVVLDRFGNFVPLNYVIQWEVD